MQYLSPSSVLGESISSPLDKRSIQLGRKKLLAELELLGGDSLDIHGTKFTKGNIIDYFENLQQEHVLNYHNAVAQDPALKTFLEQHTLVAGADFHDDPIYDDPGFLQWISAYFLHAFSIAADRCFKEVDQLQLEMLMAQPLLMTDYDREQGWSVIRKIVGNSLAMLEYLRDTRDEGKKDKQTFDNAAPFMTFEYLSLIRLLPEDRFSEIRNKYAFVIEQAAIAVFNKMSAYRSEAEGWVENALLIALDPDLRTELEDKVTEMRRISGPKESNKSFWGIARFAWLFIFVIVKALTCKSDSQSPEMRNMRYTITAGDSTFKNLNENEAKELLLGDSTREHLLDSFRHLHPGNGTDHRGDSIRRRADSINYRK